MPEAQAEATATVYKDLKRFQSSAPIAHFLHDQASIEFCRQKDPESLSRALTGFAWSAETEARFRPWSEALGSELQGFTIGRGYLSQVFYDRDAILPHWGP